MLGTLDNAMVNGLTVMETVKSLNDFKCFSFILFIVI